jgi:uncharacterized membrane protein
MGEPRRTRLVFLGFSDEAPARDALGVVEQGARNKEVVLDDWALVTKAQDGKVSIHSNKGRDPGAARGAAFGGAAGMVVAAIAGPIGVGAALTGAAIGAITAGIKDSGMKTEDIETVSRYMEDGRAGLMLALPLAEAEKWDAFVAAHDEFARSDRQHHADIVPGRTFEDALAEYRRNEEGA